MSTAGSWSVKGIDPKAREIARDLARRSGLTLGEWLNQVITDTDEPPAPLEREREFPPQPSAPPSRNWAEAARRPAPSTASGAAVLNAETFRSRLREVGRGPEAGEAARVSRALADLTARLEAAEHRSTLAISGIDQQALGVLARLDGVERGQSAAAVRFETTLEEVREAQAQVAERLKRMEGDVGPRVEAMKALEGALGRVAAQIQEGESRARAQAVETREDVAAVGRRLDRVEDRPDTTPVVEAALQRLTERVDRMEDRPETAHVVEAALQRLTERVDSLDAAPPPAFDTSSLDAAYARLTGRLDDDGRRTAASIRALETAFSDLGGRVERAEAAPAAAAGAADDAFARLAARLDEAQARTGAAVRALETSFAGLDQRIARTEAAAAHPAAPEPSEDPHRLERLAAELHARVDDARSEMATRLRDAADGKLDRMEAAVRDLSEQVAHTEQRSADAIDRMGREVVRIAQGLDGRVGEVERRSDERAAQMGGEMARIADAVENRLSRADGVQAEALEKLGGEIARIAEKLADRIAASERRNAQDLTHGLDEVSEQLQRATDKLNSRYESAGAELADRIRASEERTHRLLSEARERVEGPPARPAPSPPAAETDPRFSPPERPRIDLSSLLSEPEEDDEAPAAPRAEPAFAADRFEPADDLDPFGGFDLEPPHRPEPVHPAPAAFDAPFDSYDPFTAAVERAGAPPPVTAEVRPGSTRELIERARAAARANAERNRRPSRSGRAAGPADELFSTPAPGFQPEEASGLRSRFTMPKLRRRESGTAKTIVYASIVAIPLSVAALGAVLKAGEGRGRAAAAVEAPTAAPAPLAAPPASLPTLAVAEAAPEPAAAPVPELAPAVAPVRAAAPAASGRALYNDAVRQMERGDRGGVETLRRAANLGYAPAQFHLGKLYEDGASGLSKDAAQARRWTERAARNGDAKAMFNYGLFLANGEGVSRDDKAAVDWFHRAADAGVKDAQFNLAVMTQQGRGAAANSADAYKWYLIAAADGDAGARQSADTLKPQLTADARTAAERSAAAFRAQQAAVAGAAQVRTASN